MSKSPAIAAFEARLRRDEGPERLSRPVSPKRGRAAAGAGTVAPDSDAAARDAAHKARAGSAKLRLALLRYGAKHGLPNLSPRQCRGALELLRKGGKGRRAPPARGRDTRQGAAIDEERRRNGTRG